MTQHAAASSATRTLVETAATGVALASGLVWFGSCLVGSFRPAELGRPFWPSAGGPRTDTTGVVAFGVLGVTLATSEALRVARRVSYAARSHDSRTDVTERHTAMSGLAVAATGVAAAVLLLSIGLVVYLSVNGVTHPATLAVQATHLASWPDEGTLRVIGLATAALAAGWLRWISIRHRGSWVGS
jgi:hypothetical protein